MKIKVPVSILMAVYAKETAANLQECLASIVGQTVEVDEVYIVYDGHIPYQLKQIVDYYKKLLTITTLQLRQNTGLAKALNAGLPNCRNELVARMDSDDIMLPWRIEKQYQKLSKSNLDILGGLISEFTDDPQQAKLVSHYLSEHQQIVKQLPTRSPMAHVTTMFRKSVVLAVGGYRDDGMMLEDYYLWSRLYLAGARFGNLMECLVYVRIKGQVTRRRGINYFRSELRLLKWMHRNKISNLPQFIFNVLIRGTVRMIPKSATELVYEMLLRSNTHKISGQLGSN